MTRQRHSAPTIRQRTGPRLPWWLWLLAAVTTYVWLGGLAADGGADTLARLLAGLGRWLLPAAFLVAGAAAWWQRRRASDTRQPAPDLTQPTASPRWQADFPTLVDWAVRIQGYRYATSPEGEPSRGADLLLGPNGERALLYTRQWQTWQVGPEAVEALIGAMPPMGAGRGYLIIPGEFTRDAYRAAHGHEVELIDGSRLRHMVEGATGRGTVEPPEPMTRHPLMVARLLLQLVAIVLAGWAIWTGFSWITQLPDKRLEPPAPDTAATPSSTKDAKVLMPEPPAPEPAAAPEAAPAVSAPPPPRSIEAAFEAFYVPPPGCSNPSSREEMVACANDRMRARHYYMSPKAQPTSQPVSQPAPAPRSDNGMTEDDALVNDPHQRAEGWLEPSPDPIDAVSPEADAGWGGSDAPYAPTESPQTDEWHDEDPAATYAPYDPKAPWSGR